MVRDLMKLRRVKALMCFTAPTADIRVYNLITAYRTYGHLLAETNPISTKKPGEVVELSLLRLGFSAKEEEELFPTCGLLPEKEAKLKDIVAALKDIYCRGIGIEYMGLQNPAVIEWLQQRIEPSRFRPNLAIEQKKAILTHLNRSELFEVFLHTKYTGQKRFSLEGGETLIPILAGAIDTGANLGVEEFFLGLAHRGRLNVLANILNKSYGDIFSEFEDYSDPGSFEGSGDVKYHKGYRSEVETDSGRKVKLCLAANPSHLESVDAVLLGHVRARQVAMNDAFDKAIPILIHGDAAIAGQGVVYETLQLYRLPGYATGGCIHIIINNQIGFTTLPKDARSTRYCTDIAQGFNAPVFHVNGENPEECVHATQLAIELRQRFRCDVFIELNCYRKYGHNEGDEPAFTQPLEYQLIRKKKPIRELYRDDLIQQGVVERKVAEGLEEKFRAGLQEVLSGKKEELQQREALNEEEDFPQKVTKHTLFDPVDTTCSKKELIEVAEAFCQVPEGFNIHRKLKRVVDGRLKMLQGDPDARVIDWGMGEHLAFGSLLWEGTHIRLSGQDSRRGTFSHRHAMWMDQKQQKKYFPLSHLKKDQGRFDVFNSPLSEYAVLGFEFGYSLGYETALVIWEAQFGDFCNGAQIIIDQYLATAEQKWGTRESLVLFLPHGYEGQGPEHSSARIERFLQLAGDYNMQVVNPTNPAQLFHLLRRQIKRTLRKPLVVFTPKALLRHPICASSFNEIAEGRFQEVIDDEDAGADAKLLLFSCGKIYYDLVAEREERGLKDVAIVRVEQLYPLHKEALAKLIKKYGSAKRCFWVQEEPSNMGGWDFIRPQLQELLPKDLKLEYAGRQRSASPAVGSFSLHKQEHRAVMKVLFG